MRAMNMVHGLFDELEHCLQLDYNTCILIPSMHGERLMARARGDVAS